MNPIETDNVSYAFLYFYHRDKMNSAIHMSGVKFSPITFGLANVLDHHLEGLEVVPEQLREVLEAAGKYDLDRGR